MSIKSITDIFLWLNHGALDVQNTLKKSQNNYKKQNSPKKQRKSERKITKHSEKSLKTTAHQSAVTNRQLHFYDLNQKVTWHCHFPCVQPADVDILKA